MVLKYELVAAFGHQHVCREIRGRQQRVVGVGEERCQEQPPAVLAVGIDTEWGAKNGPPAVLQFAAGRRAWLVDVDALAANDLGLEALKLLLHWLFCTDGVQVKQ
jgi:hypothetical protein